MQAHIRRNISSNVSLWSTLVCAALLVSVAAAQWDAETFPNPTTQAGATKCGLRSAGNLCDPDNILTEDERYRLNHELTRLEARTRQDFGRSFCEKKGITAVLGIARNVRGNSEEAVRQMATDLRQRWDLDHQCEKSVVIIVSVDDRKFWVARDPKVPVYAEDFSQLLNDQTPLFKQRNYAQALGNIVKGTADVAIAKAGQAPPPSDVMPDKPRGPGVRPTDSGDAGGFKIPSIPLWVWLAIVGVIIPLLLCCGCIYCCCCRNKTRGAERSQLPADDPDGRPMPNRANGEGMGGSGAWGDRARGFLSGAGGGMAANMVTNFFNRRGRGGGGAVPEPGYPMTGGGGADPVDMTGRGSYVPPRPVDVEEGKGLYPSTRIEDKGAGGGW